MTVYLYELREEFPETHPTSTVHRATPVADWLRTRRQVQLAIAIELNRNIHDVEVVGVEPTVRDLGPMGEGAQRSTDGRAVIERDPIGTGWSWNLIIDGTWHADGSLVECRKAYRHLRAETTAAGREEAAAERAAEATR